MDAVQKGLRMNKIEIDTSKIIHVERYEPTDREEFVTWVNENCRRIGFEYTGIHDYVFTGACKSWDFYWVFGYLFKRDNSNYKSVDYPHGEFFFRIDEIKPKLPDSRSVNPIPLDILCSCGSFSFGLIYRSYALWATCIYCGKVESVYEG